MKEALVGERGRRGAGGREIARLKKESRWCFGGRRGCGRGSLMISRTIGEVGRATRRQGGLSSGGKWWKNADEKERPRELAKVAKHDAMTGADGTPALHARR